MSEDNITKPVGSTPAVSKQEWRQQIGESLGAARQVKNLSLAQVAEHLKLRVTQVKQIESGDWEQLPGAVFTRGFIRNYAAFLQMSDDILPLLDKALPSTAIQMQKTNTQPAAAAPKAHRRRLPAWLKVVLVLAAVAVVVYLWQSRSARQNQQQVADELTEAAQAPTPEINHGNVVVVPLPDEAQRSGEVAAAGSSDAAASATAAVNDNILYINTKYRTFLSVSDAAGKTLINQLVPGGSRQQLSGNPPYQIRIGYALGSTVELNGRNYQMAPYLNGKTATLTVPAP